jgi:predicted O-methyltransferase YrrM
MTARPQSGISGCVRRAIRIAQLGAVRAAASAANLLHRKARRIEVRLDGLHKGLDVRPIADIPWPRIDLTIIEDPVAAVFTSREFEAATAFFTDNPAARRSLVSPQAQALLYSILRNLRPDHVFEIGSYKAGTTEALCRALHANGHGIVHTVDPFRGDYIVATLRHWPPKLLDHVRVHPMSSMDFYVEMERQGIQPGVVFVDGNHDYEFALFDIGRGAKYMTHGGFIFVDNVAQPGPFSAACVFIATNPGWRELGGSNRDSRQSKSFDRARSTIANTDFMVLRAPDSYVVTDRSSTFGRIRWWLPAVKGIELELGHSEVTGLLDVQVVLRGFGAQPTEAIGETTIQLDGASGRISVPIEANIEGQFTYFTVETWLIWRGGRPLHLATVPKPY